MTPSNSSPRGSLLALSWILRLVAAGILVQTLFFKFSGAEESVAIFSRLGVEPWGRIATGVAELVVSILLLVPATAGIGGLGAAGVMAGAIGSHLTILGIEVQDDGGTLFGMALVVFVAGLVVAWIHRAQIAALVARVRGRGAAA